MASLRSLLQYTDTERKWLLAEDGDVERHLSPAGLRNAAVWRTTETFSAEPFTQGMMDAPDSALGMDLAYLSSAAAAAIIEPLVEAAAPETRALATANPMTVGRFLYDEDAHEMILRLHFAGNVTIMRYKVLPSTGLRERSVTM
eukprot:contig_28182_g6923